MTLPTVSVTAETRDLRKYPRVELDAGIWTEIWRGQVGQERAVSGVLTVLSPGGAFLQIRERFEIGAAITVRFTLPESDDRVVCGGLVRHAVPNNGIGLEFVRVPPTDRERLLAATWDLGV